MKTKVFSAVFAIATLLLLVWSCSTSEPAPAPPPATTAVDVSATDIATTGFTLSFSVAVPELAATDIKLDADATVTSIAVSGTENKVYTVVTSALTEGKVYNVSIGKANYTFNPAPLALTIPKSTDTKVNVTFSNITTTGFTLSLSAVVTGLVATDITLSNSATISSITGADTKTVNVVCSALTAGSTYTVTIAKAGFSFAPQPLTFTVPSAPVAGVQITDFRIGSPTIATLKTGVIAVSTGANTISNAPRWLHADKATVKAYFTLPAGATAAVGTTALASGDKLDLNSGTATIKVTNGTDTADYTITLAAYEATSNPYGIYTPGDLSDMRNGLAGSYKLMNDVTLPALTGGDADVVSSMAITDYATAGWLPVGANIESNIFSGNIDGGDHKIVNLTISRQNTSNIGLLAFKAAGEIKKLSLMNINITATNATGIGGLVGYASAGTIINCNVTGVITSTGNNIGGLVGGNSRDNISFCSSAVNISGGDLVGGLVGKAEGTIRNSYSKGSLTVRGGAGGLVGFAVGIIIDSYATGDVTSTTVAGIGGLTGVLAGVAKIVSSYCTGVVSGVAPNNLTGGIVGEYYGTITNSYWDTTTSKLSIGVGTGTSTGATGKTTAEMKAGTPYDATWTATNWTFTAGQYPKLVGVGGQ